MEASGQFHAPTALQPGKSSRYQLDRRLGVPKSRCDAVTKRKNSSLPLRGIVVAFNLHKMFFNEVLAIEMISIMVYKQILLGPSSIRTLHSDACKAPPFISTAHTVHCVAYKEM